MKALSIKQPYAFQILTGEKTIEYRTWLPGTVKQFLLVSSQTPANDEFTLGLPNGYAFAIVSITAVSKQKNSDGLYEWHVAPTVPVQPFAVKGKLHFYDIPDGDITKLPELTKSMQAFWRDSLSPKGDAFKNNFLQELINIGIDQMPKRYLQFLDKHDNDWDQLAEYWAKTQGQN